MRATIETLIGIAGLVAFATSQAQPVAREALLPPLAGWQAGSLDLIVASDDPWITPAERSGLRETPRYDETMAWLQRLTAAAPELAMLSIGKSDQGRDIWMVVANAEGADTAAGLAKSGRPVVLVQAGIHSGEIDGKDAGLMLLRDMTVAGKRADLLDKANLLFIPILNVDGHERFSGYGRINQRGPEQMGWRSNSRNLNLNRDYTKLETPGVRAVVSVIDEWQPDFYVDVHVTDGVDYLYDITWGYNGSHAWSPSIANWLARYFDPLANRALEERGHVPGPLVFAKNEVDYSAGISAWTASPRFSSGYGDARHVPTVLVENHSLKPYMQRVLGTYVLLEAVMRAAGDNAAELDKAIRSDRRSRPKNVVLQWREDPATLPESILFKGIDSFREYSPVTGDSVVRWTGQPVELAVAVRANDRPAVTVARPNRYYIPAEWSFIGDKLRAHGIAVASLATAQTVAVRRYRLPQAAVAGDTNPFEGRLRVIPGSPVTEASEVTFAAGSLTVATDQPLGTLAMLLLEPQSPDSFFQWGYFLEIMNRTEYFEAYVIETLASRMLVQDPELARRFRQKLAADQAFADDPDKRLRWFYEQTPYFDERYRLYPIASSLN